MNSYLIEEMYLHYISIFVLHFMHNLFFLLIKFLNTSSWRKIHSIKLSRNGHQKVFLLNYWRNMQVWTLVYEVVCKCGLEFLKTFLKIFVMFVNECEIVLIISNSTEYEFSAAFFIFKVLLWSICYYYQGWIQRFWKGGTLLVGHHGWPV